MAERGISLRTFLTVILLIIFPVASTKVLIDASHGQHSIDSSMYGMSRLVENLEKNGFTVFENRNPISEDSLKGFDILVLPSIGFGMNFNESEINAIRNFVDTGGSLLVLVDAYKRAPEIYNDITEPYGISIRHNLILDPKVIAEVKNFSDHLITKDLYKIILDCGSPLTVSGNAEILAWTSGSSWADNLENNGSASYNHLHDPEEEYGPFPVVAINDGAGRVMVIGGGYLFENTCLNVAELRHEHEDLLYENERFALNVFKWLARRPFSREEFRIEFNYEVKKVINESKPNYLTFNIRNPNSFVIENAKIILNTSGFRRTWNTILASNDTRSYNASWHPPLGKNNGYLILECKATDGRIIKKAYNFTYDVIRPIIEIKKEVEVNKTTPELVTKTEEKKPLTERINIFIILLPVSFAIIFFGYRIFKRRDKPLSLYSVKRRDRYRYRFR